MTRTTIAFLALTLLGGPALAQRSKENKNDDREARRKARQERREKWRNDPRRQKLQQLRKCAQLTPEQRQQLKALRNKLNAANKGLNRYVLQHMKRQLRRGGARRDPAAVQKFQDYKKRLQEVHRAFRQAAQAILTAAQRKCREEIRALRRQWRQEHRGPRKAPRGRPAEGRRPGHGRWLNAFPYDKVKDLGPFDHLHRGKRRGRHKGWKQGGKGLGQDKDPGKGNQGADEEKKNS